MRVPGFESRKTRKTQSPRKAFAPFAFFASSWFHSSTHTILAVSDAQGHSRGHLWYDPHGSVLTTTLPVTLTERIFSTQGLDSRLGLMYHGDGRYYDPFIAHSLQPDPFGGVPHLPQALNRYAVPTAGSVAGQVQARGGDLAIAAAGELAEELTEASIGKAVGWYAARRTVVDVGKLVLQTRRYSFLVGAGFSKRFTPAFSSGVAVGGDAVQEWVGTVTALEMDEILAAGGDDILEAYFRQTGTEVLGDTALKQFLRSATGEFVTGTLADAAIETVFLPFQDYWHNPYLTGRQKAWQTGLTYGNVVVTGLILIFVPEALIIRIGIAVAANLTLKWVEPQVFPGAYAEHRQLRPLQ